MAFHLITESGRTFNLPVFRPSLLPSPKILVSSLLLSVLQPNHALAGKYELVEGKGTAVCEDYLKVLAKSNAPMTCDRTIPPGYPDFNEPDWQELNAQEYKLLVLRIENYLQTPKDEKATLPVVPVHRESEVHSYLPPKNARLSTAQIDIDNDGVSETIAKYRSHFCHLWDLKKAPTWKAPILVIKEGQHINVDKTYPLMQNPEKVYVSNADQSFSRRQAKFEYRYSQYAPGSSSLRGYDAFLYRGEAFFDLWDEDKGGHHYQTLTVYKTKQKETDEVCRYQFSQQ